MKSLKDTRNKIRGQVSAKVEIVAAKGLTRIIMIQRRWANQLTARSIQWSTRKKIFLLIGFCITGSFFIMLPLFSSVVAPTGAIDAFRNAAFEPANTQEDTSIMGYEKINQEEYERVAHLKKFLDSLHYSPEGKEEYNKIIQQYPGLIDSLNIVSQWK